MKFFVIASCFLALTPAHGLQLLAGSDATAHAVPQARWPLDIEALKKTLRQTPAMREIDFSWARIVAPPDFTTGKRDPEIEFRKIQQEPQQKLLFVTLRCRERKVCATFLVKVELLRTAQSAARDARLAILPMVFSARPSGVAAGREPVLVQPHTPARLVIEEDGLQITEMVLPSRNARLGEVVRVTGAATHRSRLGEVEGLNLLHPVEVHASRPGVAR